MSNRIFTLKYVRRLAYNIWHLADVTSVTYPLTAQ